MHIPWGWAKQRPHFLAEELVKNYDVEVCCLKSYRKKNQRTEQSNNFKIRTIFVLPFGSKFRVLNFLNDILIQIQVVKRISNFDIIWFTSPIFGYIKTETKAKYVYDCMDDFLEFPDIKSKSWLASLYFKKEARLIETVSSIIFTSKTLKNRVLERHSFANMKPAIVVNNAIKEMDFSGINEVQLDRKKNEINLVYIGTVSSWLDIKLIIDHICYDKSVVYNLYGPSEIEIPSFERLHYHGPIKHSEVFERMDSADVLVMPFIVTSLIESVNPVKLYEYIYTGKAVVACQYGESELFSDFVYLYVNKGEYFETIDEIRLNHFMGKAKIQDCRDFVRQNTWTERGIAIRNFLSSSLL